MQKKRGSIIRPWGRGNLAAAMTAKIIVHGSKQPTRRQRNTWRGLAWRLKKPLETSPLELGADGMMEYRACQYVVLGSCEENYRHTVGGVEVCKARFYPETGVKEEHFVLELSPIRLKGWQE